MITNDIVGNTRGADGTVERGRVRLFAQGVPALKTLPDEVLAALRTGGENDLPTRQLARFVKEAAERHVPAMKGDLLWRRDRHPPGGGHFPLPDAGGAGPPLPHPPGGWP